MDAETAKALNSLSKKLNAIQQQLDRYFGLRTDELKTEVTDTQVGLAESYEQALANADELTNIELAVCEIYENMEV